MAGGYSVTISAVDAATATLEGVNKRFEALNKRVAAAAAPFKRLGDQMNRFGEVTGIDKVATGFKNFGIAAGEAWRSVSRVVEPLAAITGAASIAGIVRLTQAWADYLEQIVQVIGAEEHELRYAGRGRCADPVDCAALISNQTAVMTSLIQLAKDMVQPFDGPIQVVTPDGEGDGKPFTVSPNLGETVYESVERLARFEGLLVYENAAGNVVLSRVGKVKHTSGFAEGKNIQSAEFVTDMSQRFSKYDAFTIAQDTLSRSGANPEASGNFIGSATDPEVTRYRPRVIISEQMNTDGQLALQRARWEAQRRKGRSFRVDLVADSWLDSAGTPWTPNQVAPVLIPSLGLDEPGWVITDVRYRRDDRSGTTVQVTLMPPEADCRTCRAGRNQPAGAEPDRDADSRAADRSVSAERAALCGERWAACLRHPGGRHLMRVQDTHRRVLNSMVFGRTTGRVFVDTDGLPKVQVRLSPIELKTLTLVQGRGLGKNMPIGTPVVALFQGGDRSNGVVMGSTDPGNRPAMAGDEDTSIYGYGFSIIVTSDGVHITAPNVWFTGNIHVVGEVTAKAGTGASVTLSQHRGHVSGGPPPTPGT